ncbi:mitochondrial carrier domain-containing protein [Scenedesmus sp. NREL 46B-D3]|nr:mitochondrial carrier domain-containing protein [Scenedesmus sp. NREL 46B-D3]
MSGNKQPSRVTPVEHTLIGAVGGVMEVCLMQPMVAFKNALQEGRPLPTTPSQMYRGLLINCGSIAPITASQFGTNRFMERTLMQRTGRQQLSSVERFGCAATAGAVSALVATPTELVIIQQQKKGTSLLQEVKHFAASYPAYSAYRGLWPCVMRETLYAAGYLGLCPVLFDKLKDSQQFKPFDTIKTRMQAAMYAKPEYLSWTSTAATIHREGGMANFWSGLLPRMTRIIAATFILINVRSTVTPLCRMGQTWGWPVRVCHFRVLLVLGM